MIKHYVKTVDTAPRLQSPMGLGDAVAVVAQPIARALDATIGTHLVGCQPCGKRQEKMNKILPNINPLSK